MTQQHTPLRPALTAIAAVLALSSTVAFAQSADPDASAPAIAAPAAPAVSATPPAALQSSDVTPVAPTTSDASAALPDTPAPIAAMATQSAPVVHQPDTASGVTAPHATRTARTVVHSATVATRSRSPAPAALPAAAPVPIPAAAPRGAATARTTTTTQSSTDDTLPIAGAIAVGLLAIGGGAYALSRRRREDEEDEAEEIFVPTERTILVEPPYVATAAAPIVAHDGDEVMALPSGFDLSGFGRHTRAAYRGPTPDNPSASLRTRLRHASFFDQREREAADQGIPVPTAPVTARAAKAEAADTDQIVVRPNLRRKFGFFGTAFQR